MQQDSVRDDKYWNAYGMAYFKKGKYTQAHQCYQKAIEISPDAKYYYHLGKAEHHLNEDQKASQCYQNAIHYCQKAIALAPENFSNYYLLGDIHAELKQDEVARYYYLVAYQKTQGIHEDYLYYREKISKMQCLVNPDFSAYNALGDVQYDQNRYHDALESYNQAGHLNHRLFANNIGDALYAIGDSCTDIVDKMENIKHAEFYYYNKCLYYGLLEAIAENSITQIFSHNLAALQKKFYEYREYDPLTVMTFTPECPEELQLDSAAVNALVRAIKREPSVQEIKIQGNEAISIGDIGVYELTAILGEDSFLKILTLNHCNITAEGLAYLMEVLKRNHSLISLDLSDNDLLDDKSVTLIADMLKINKKLKKLILLNCGIGEGGIKKLEDAIENNSTLLEFKVTSDYHLDQIEPKIRKNNNYHAQTHFKVLVDSFSSFPFEMITLIFNYYRKYEYDWKDKDGKQEFKLENLNSYYNRKRPYLFPMPVLFRSSSAIQNSSNSSVMLVWNNLRNLLYSLMLNNHKDIRKELSKHFIDYFFHPSKLTALHIEPLQKMLVIFEEKIRKKQDQGSVYNPEEDKSEQNSDAPYHFPKPLPDDPFDRPIRIPRPSMNFFPSRLSLPPLPSFQKLKSQVDIERVGQRLYGTHKTDDPSKTFAEYKIVGDGNCGFVALGINRKEAVSILSRLWGNEEARSEIIKELIESMDNNQLNSGEINPSQFMLPRIRDNFKELYQELQRGRTHLNSQLEMMRKKLQESKVTLPEGNSDENIIKMIKKSFPSILLADSKKLSEAILKAEKEDKQQLDRIRDDKEIFMAYINSYDNGHNRGLWLGVNSMYWIANERGMGFTLWSVNEATYRLQQIKTPLPSKILEAGSVNIIMRGGHYNFLVEDNENNVIKAFEEESKAVAVPSSLSIPPASIRRFQLPSIPYASSAISNSNSSASSPNFGSG